MATVKTPPRRRPARQSAEAPAKTPVQVQTRATGWKIPLMFCAFFAILWAGTWVYRHVTAPPPLQFNEELIEITGKSTFNLDSDEQGRKYKEIIISGGRGFSSNDVMDARVEKTAYEALEAGRIDAVVTASQVIRDKGKRNQLLHNLATACAARCDMLPWAVYAARNVQNDYPLAVQLSRDINRAWEVCVARGQKPVPTTSATFVQPEPAAGAQLADVQPEGQTADQAQDKRIQP